MKKVLVTIIGIFAMLVLSVMPVNAQGAFFGGLLGGMLGSSSGGRAGSVASMGAAVLYRLPELERRTQNPLGIMTTAVECSFAKGDAYPRACSGVTWWEIFRMGQSNPERYEILEIRISPPDQGTALDDSTKATFWFFYAKKDDVAPMPPRR